MEKIRHIKTYLNFILENFEDMEDLTEGVRWYHNGKLEPSDPFEMENDEEENFKPGDRVITKIKSYHRTRYFEIVSEIIAGFQDYTKEPQEVHSISVKSNGIKMMRLMHRTPWYICSEWKKYTKNDNNIY